jgi:hypothetical protein
MFLLSALNTEFNLTDRVPKLISDHNYFDSYENVKNIENTKQLTERNYNVKIYG